MNCAVLFSYQLGAIGSVVVLYALEIIEQKCPHLTGVFSDFGNCPFGAVQRTIIEL
jgi:hypothetical protein